MMRPGFSLMEVMIFVALAAMLSGALFAAFWQIQLSASAIEETVAIDTSIALVYNQLEKDLAGTFVPQVNLASTETDKKPAAQKEEQKKQKKPKPLKPVFMSKNKQDMLTMLTFITTNPVTAYRSTKPRFVRLMYQLKPDPDWQDSFILTRQESVNPDIKVFAKESKERPREYEIARNIKRMSSEYLFFKQAKKKEKEESPKAPELVTVTEWNPTSKDQPGETPLPAMPQYMRIKLELWDAPHETVEETEFLFSLPAYDLAQLAWPPKKQKTSAQPTADQKPQKEEDAFYKPGGPPTSSSPTTQRP